MAFPLPKYSRWASIEDDSLYHLRLRQGSNGKTHLIHSLKMFAVYAAFLTALVTVPDDTSVTSPSVILTFCVMVFVWTKESSMLKWHFNGMEKHLAIGTAIFGKLPRSTIFPIKQISLVTYSRRDTDDGTYFTIQPSFLDPEPSAHYKKRYDLTVGDEPAAQHICNRINAWLDSHRPPA